MNEADRRKPATPKQNTLNETAACHAIHRDAAQPMISVGSNHPGFWRTALNSSSEFLKAFRLSPTVVAGFIILGLILLGEILASVGRFLMSIRADDFNNLLECAYQASQAFLWCGSFAFFYFASIFFLSLFRREEAVRNALLAFVSFLFLAAVSFWFSWMCFLEGCSRIVVLGAKAMPLAVCVVACFCAWLTFWSEKD